MVAAGIVVACLPVDAVVAAVAADTSAATAANNSFLAFVVAVDSHPDPGKDCS